MDKIKLKNKLEKLRAMALLGHGSEAENAQRIYDSLVKKYQFSGTALEEKKETKIPCTSFLADYLPHIAEFLGIRIYRYKNNPYGNYMFIEATESDTKMFLDIVFQLRDLYRQKENELRLQLKSYMRGFVSTSYSLPKKDPVCPECASKIEFDGSAGRYRCTFCEYQSKKVKTFFVDSIMYNKGKSESGKLLTA